MLLGCAKFVDTQGVLKPGSVQANQIVFEKKSEHMGKLSQYIIRLHLHLLCILYVLCAYVVVQYVNVCVCLPASHDIFIVVKIAIFLCFKNESTYHVVACSPICI